MEIAAPVDDDDVPRYWRELGLPGLVDVHVHFLPERVQAKVWQYFAEGETHYGAPWPLAYALPDEERLAVLDRLGVRAFPTLPYPHKAGMAAWLNDWSAEFAAAPPAGAAVGHLLPRAGGAGLRRRGARRAAPGSSRCTCRSGGFDPRDPLLDAGLGAGWRRPARRWSSTAARARCAASTPGPVPVTGLLERYPRLQLVIAHLGMPEYRDFLELAERYERVHLDTTMFATDFTERLMPFDRADLPRLAALQDKVLLGSDFPSIPYPYAHQLAALHRLDLGEDWLRAVLWHNGARLFRIEA